MARDVDEQQIAAPAQALTALRALPPLSAVAIQLQLLAGEDLESTTQPK